MPKPATVDCPRCQGKGRVIDQKALGAKFQALRLAAGVSLSKVAKTMGYSAPYLSHLERGLRPWNDELGNYYRFALHELEEQGKARQVTSPAGETKNTVDELQGKSSRETGDCQTSKPNL